MKRLLGLSVVVLAVMALVLATALAQPGVLDPTWGDEGMTLTDFDGMDDLANAAALMDDGKWVLAGWVNSYPGDFGAARYLASGRLDPSFGDGGKVVTAFTDDPDLVDAAWQAGARPNGGVFVVGETCDADYIICQLAVAAYTADGSLDESFGEDGLVTTDPGTGNSLAWPHRLIVQPDEKLVIGGIVFQDDDAVDLVFVRYHPDGSLDDTFGDGGIAILDLADADNFVQDIVALPGDKFLAVGGFGAYIDPINNDPDAGFLARMNSDGSLDTSFAGRDGFVTWDNDGALTQGREVLITPDNLILVLGQVATDNGVDCTLHRYDMEGNLDTTFGDQGQVVIDSGQSDECLKMGLTPDGKLVITGPSVPAESLVSESENSMDTATRRAAWRAGRLVRQAPANANIEDDPNGNILARYNLDGTPDATFGENGLVHFSINEGDGFVYNLAVQRDGKILVAGDVSVGDFLDFGVLRFLGDGPAAQVYAPVVVR
jgi:uncharacterized delta-60 repeat protein